MTASIPLWRTIQKNNFIHGEALADYLELSEENRKKILFSPRFSLNLPRRLAAKITKNKIDDPIFRQFVPLLEETAKVDGYLQEPLQDTRFRKTEKLIQKYQGRALLIATSACAMHCRFCFRQNFPYETKTASFAKELDHLARDASLSEVILSGGDPLSLSDAALSSLLQSLNGIPHLRRIRFHSRFPIGIPERVDENFLTLLAASQKQIFFVLHCNHPIELDSDVLASMRRLQKLGIPVLNQSVLLRGVNDDPDTLLALSELLINHGIVPYYLHALDPIEGGAHFDIPASRGKELIRSLQEQCSGFAVPRFVREIPGEPGKTNLLFYTKRNKSCPI